MDMPMDHEGPLSGVRIVELDAIGPVPFAAMLLADLGADVVRVVQPGGEGSGIVPALYRGRRELVLDFRHPAAIAELLDLIDRADGLVEGMAPRSAAALGIGPDRCRARNPRLAYGRASMWGSEGPMAERPGSDINVLALTGALHAIGEPDMPAVPLTLIGDHAGCGLFLALGMVSAILAAQASGQGRLVDAAAMDGVGTLMALTQNLAAAGRWVDRRAANLVDGGAPFYRCYRCSDDRHVAVGAIDAGAFAELCAGLGLDAAKIAQFDRAAWPHLAREFTRRFASRSRDEWTARFPDGAACVTPVLSLAEAARHPHALARRPLAQGPMGGAVAPRFDPPAPVVGAARPTSLTEILGRWVD